MTEKQLKQVAVQKAIMEVMEKNLTKWQSITELKGKYDQFIRNIKKIDDYSAVFQTDLAPLKQKRTESTQVLVEQLFPVTSVLGVYASDMGDKKLGKLTSMKFTELEKSSHSTLVKHCLRVMKISGKLLEQQAEKGKKPPKHLLADYGLTPKYLDTLKGALDKCIQDEAGYREIRLKKRKSQVKLEKRIRDNNVLLKKKIDRIMHLFRDTQKTFYNAYIKARIPVEAEPVASETKETVAKPALPNKKPAAVTKKTVPTAKKPAAAAKKPATTRKPPAKGTGAV